MELVTVSAPGKVILAGEHAVVYGQLGIWSAIDKRLYVTVQSKEGKLKITSDQESDNRAVEAVIKIGELIGEDVKNNLDIQITSEIDVGYGMGSSAALSVALTKGLVEYFGLTLSLEKINKIAFECEKIFHGSPSGGDNSASAYGGFLKYQRRENAEPSIEKISHSIQIKNLVAIKSGKPKETTIEMVGKVKAKYKENRIQYDNIFSRIGEIAQEFYKHLTMKNEVDIGELIRENHKLLNELPVISPSAQSMINKIVQAGGAAKISGAGGLADGSGILLAYHDDPKVLVSLSNQESWNMESITLGVEGVRVE